MPPAPPAAPATPATPVARTLADFLLDHVDSLGHRTFRDGAMNLNLIGVRAANRKAGTFDDWFTVTFRDTPTSPLRTLVFPATTDPGVPYLAEPMRPEGTAILVPGQYRGAFTFGKHLGKYECLVQRLSLPVWRDGNRDGILDTNGPAVAGMYGIHIHSTQPGRDRDDVGKFSAGCQVLRNWGDFTALMRLAHQAAARWGDHFTYTLIGEWDGWREAVEAVR